MEEADWADDIAVKLFDGFCSDDNIVEPTAKALRKAKAEGMRALIKQVEDQQAIYESKMEMLLAREKSPETDANIERTENYMEALRYISEEWAELADKTERGG